MAEFKHPDHAHIFILKLWQEVLDDEQNHKQTEWRGKIQDVFNGETHYFRDWPTIVKFISNIYPELATRRRQSPKSRVERLNAAKKTPDLPTRRRAAARE